MNRRNGMQEATTARDIIRTALIRLAQRSDVTQERIADACGVNQSTVSRWLSGQADIPARALSPIEVELGTYALTSAYARERGVRFVPLDADQNEALRGRSEFELAAVTTEASTRVVSEIARALGDDGEISDDEAVRIDAALEDAEHMIQGVRAELRRRREAQAQRAQVVFAKPARAGR